MIFFKIFIAFTIFLIFNTNEIFAWYYHIWICLTPRCYSNNTISKENVTVNFIVHNKTYDTQKWPCDNHIDMYPTVQASENPLLDGIVEIKYEEHPENIINKTIYKDEDCKDGIEFPSASKYLTKRIDQAKRPSAIEENSVVQNIPNSTIQIVDGSEENMTPVGKKMNASKSLVNYDGSKREDITHWLKKLECCFDIDGINEGVKKMAVIKIKASQKIIEYIETLTETDRRSYQRAITLLKEKYNGSISIQN
uniref:Uncharacterized protein n=1 Tax=Strongyloides papillosus TaxID=174720 RepID=A0A0N5BIV1_STREA